MININKEDKKMKRFDEKGMMVFPNPLKKDFKDRRKVLVVKECYCPNGHNLISKRAIFHGQPGIMLKVKKQSQTGLIALSPLYGEKTRVTIDIDLEKDELVSLHCPHCDAELPVFTDCHCGGKLVAAYTSLELDFSHALTICNRVDCCNATLRSGGDIIKLTSIDSL
jgi:hypothetical protein